MAVQKKYPALGRGLDALISTGEVHTSGSSSIGEVDIRSIVANPNQPRREFDAEALEELAESIRQIGVIQPITLRKMDDDENMMQMALVENIQREDLNAIEIALAYQNLIEQYDLTQDALSEKVGKKRATIANYLRLLKLPAQVQMALQKREMDQGHARALLGLQQPSLQVKLFGEIQEKGYSVRQVEEMVKEINAGGTVPSGRKNLRDKKKTLAEEYVPVRERLSEVFHTKVNMTYNKGKGSISIPFNDEYELKHVLGLLELLS